MGAMTDIVPFPVCPKCQTVHATISFSEVCCHHCQFKYWWLFDCLSNTWRAAVETGKESECLIGMEWHDELADTPIEVPAK